MGYHNLQDSDWQNLIYSLFLLALLIGGLLSRRDFTFGKILKYFAIWSVIGLSIIALYAYRFEFSELKNRIASEINPSKVRQIEPHKIVVTLSGDGHFYVNIKINGTPVRFMIDTGASDIVINMKDAQRIGVDPKRLNFNKRYQTANGVSYGASVIFKEIEFGNIKFNNVAASVNEADMGISLLGMSFLRQFKKYEFYQDRLILTF